MNPDLDLRRADPSRIREWCRHGRFDRPTSGVALGFAQANLVVVRESVAADFEQFCRRNPRPCPLLEITAPGQFEPKKTAPAADLRTDLPRYRVYRSGVCADRPNSVIDVWDEAARQSRDSGGIAARDGRGRFVAFLIGCSFTFESALLRAGLPVRHIEQSCNVPMYRTNIETTPAGVFQGPLVVSMRPMSPEQADRAAEITGTTPEAHGPPVHVGEPRAIGITDLSRPDYGDPVPLRPGEVPVFWACGVTPTEAILRAKLDLAITHEPGHMFITDKREG